MSRSDPSAGVSQNVNLQPNTNYHFTIHYKSLNQFTPWISISLLAAVDYSKTLSPFNLWIGISRLDIQIIRSHIFYSWSIGKIHTLLLWYITYMNSKYARIHQNIDACSGWKRNCIHPDWWHATIHDRTGLANAWWRLLSWWTRCVQQADEMNEVCTPGGWNKRGMYSRRMKYIIWLWRWCSLHLRWVPNTSNTYNSITYLP